MRIIDRNVAIDNEPRVLLPSENVRFKFSLVHSFDSSDVYELHLDGSSMLTEKIDIIWKIPCLDVQGVWTTNALLDKRIRADWEEPMVKSCISVDAPVISVYNSSDENVITFALSDFVNALHMEACIREEDGYLYCSITLLPEYWETQDVYSCRLLIIKDSIHFSNALGQVNKWWDKGLDLSIAPALALEPVYSTWYSFHQNFTEEQILIQSKLAKDLGYGGVIIDDGWQTKDGGRGYFYTGDWNPDRIENVGQFVDEIHKIGLYCMFWFSVPFCGVRSSVYQKFKGKFLTEDHPWAPVFDPRFPDVRAYLLSRYKVAVQDWNLDGLKLDFIDDFKVYPDTDLTEGNGKDCVSVNEGVRRLLDEIRSELLGIKPDLLIEFRQKYIGPYLKTVGNMFRAFDCPHDFLVNRVRTTDVRLLNDTAAVHSDMITWNPNCTVEVAALQFTSIIFSVIQLSVRINEIPEDHRLMIKFYTDYCTAHKNVLLNGHFIPRKPSSNYPILSSETQDTIIYGVYEDILVEIDSTKSRIHLVNGKMSEQIVFETFEDLEDVSVVILDCMGEVDWEDVVSFHEGIHALEVPSNGIIQIDQVSLGLRIA